MKNVGELICRDAVLRIINIKSTNRKRNRKYGIMKTLYLKISHKLGRIKICTDRNVGFKTTNIKAIFRKMHEWNISLKK